MKHGPDVAARLHRWRTLIGEAWRFGLVGAINIVINFVVFNALVLVVFPGGELKANVVATAVATTTSYLMNRGWTFRHRKTSRVHLEYVLFVAFNVGGLAIELAVMGLAKYGLGVTALWALNLVKLLGLGLGTVFRFWTYRSFVFAGQRVGTTERLLTAPAGAAEAPGTAETAGVREGVVTTGHGSPAGARPASASARPRPRRGPTRTRPPAAAPGLVGPAGRGELATAPIGSPPGS